MCALLVIMKSTKSSDCGGCRCGFLIFVTVALLSIVCIKAKLIKFDHGFVQQANDRLLLMKNKILNHDYELQLVKKGHTGSKRLLQKLQDEKNKMKKLLKQLSSKLKPHSLADTDGQLKRSLKKDFNEISRQFNESEKKFADIAIKIADEEPEAPEEFTLVSTLYLLLAIRCFFFCYSNSLKQRVCCCSFNSLMLMCCCCFNSLKLVTKKIRQLCAQLLQLVQKIMDFVEKHFEEKKHDYCFHVVIVIGSNICFILSKVGRYLC